jgi:hypothetical protein
MGTSRVLQEGTLIFCKVFAEPISEPREGRATVQVLSTHKNITTWFVQIYEPKRRVAIPASLAMAVVAFLLFSLLPSTAASQSMPADDAGVAVGPQYDSTHVYVAPSDFGCVR